MLHAAELGFEHPATRAPMQFEDPLPDDMRGVLAALRG
jgi:23S rRNA pseudouridine1911/1915/1917 synthase